MDELSSYYRDCRAGSFAAKDPADCGCRGAGWFLSQLDTFHACPVHYKGQRHPEDYDYPEETVPAAVEAEVEAEVETAEVYEGDEGPDFEG